MNYKYHYNGFEIEDLGDGYKVAAYHYKTLKEAMADIDNHIDARIKDLHQRIDKTLDLKLKNKKSYSLAMQRVKKLNEMIEELHNLKGEQTHA